MVHQGKADWSTPTLFTETEMDDLLADYDPETGDSYYRAILQNLFFATLNTEIGQRGFSEVMPMATPPDIATETR